MAKKAKRFSDEVLAEAARKRDQHRKVKRYLEALEQQSSNGHRADPTKIQSQLDQIDAVLATATGIERLKLTQQRLDKQSELQALSAEPATDLELLEADFVEVAGEWAERQGVTYSAMRTIGVPAKVLSAAGMRRTRVAG